MKYYSEIIPFFEASIYLTQRFDKERTSVAIAEQHKRISRTPLAKVDWTFYRNIEAYEHELDDLFEPDELMRFYFSPIETREKLQEHSLTLGGLLLNGECLHKPEDGIDRIIEYYKTESSETFFAHYRSVLFPFSGESAKTGESYPDFIRMVDEALVKKEDMWNLMDVISHPVEHLEKLRPLVCAVAKNIEARVEEFKPYLEQCRDEFCKSGLFAENLRLLGFNISEEDIDRVAIYPSIFLFSSFMLSSQNGGDIYINMGVFANRIADYRRRENNPENYLLLLKLLSDATRFKALHELCDTYSYGQELAEKLGSTKNAMYYHLEKLFSIGLVDLKVTDYRMLYTMDKEKVFDLLTALRDYLVNGWKPEGK